MKSLSYAVAAAFAQGALLAAQAPGTACCEVKVVSAADNPARLTITVKNVGQPTVLVGLTFPAFDFKVRVVSTDGRQADRTAFGKRVLKPWEIRTRYTGVRLAEGESHTEDLDITQLFELKPGSYNVVLTRAVFIDDKPVWLSAAIQIQIPKPPEP